MTHTTRAANHFASRPAPAPSTETLDSFITFDHITKDAAKHIVRHHDGRLIGKAPSLKMARELVTDMLARQRNPLTRS